MDSSAELMALSDGLFIEVELREKDVPDFNKKSLSLGGEYLTTTTGKDGVVFLRNHGTACRIYFNGEEVAKQLEMFGFIAIDRQKEPVRRGEWRKEYRYRLDSNAFFWKLVRNGFHIGRWPC